jgi:hypothetical protein
VPAAVAAAPDTVHCDDSAPAALPGPAASQAAVLPEDRADIMYHRYSGGAECGRPLDPVRKNSASRFVTGSYYVDAISSARLTW